MNAARHTASLHDHFSVAALEADPLPLLRVMRMLRAWLAVERGPAYPATPFADLFSRFQTYAVPQQGIDVAAFLDEFDDIVLANTAQLNHPKYIGHMTQALPWISVVAEALTAALNQNQVKVETAYASTLVEKQVLGWLHRLVYREDDAFYTAAISRPLHAIGNFVNGGTMGNLTALAVALEDRLPGTRERGLVAALDAAGLRGLAVLGSKRAHYSLKKSLITLGLGEQAFHAIPVDDRNRVDLDALQARIDALERERIKVICILGIAGTTETGAIDPLAELAAIAQREHAWFHVDAAWGGALLLGQQGGALCAGIEQADSVVIDGHKLLWVPMAQGAVLFKDSASLDRLRHNADYILRAGTHDLGQTSLEGSRRFDALKLWTSFKLLGRDGYASLLRQAGQLTRQMRDLLLDHQDFELITESDTFILTYRFVPRRLRPVLAALLAAGDTAGLAEANARISALNVALQERQKATGASFVSRTALESTNYPGAIAVLRVVLTNVHTTAAHLREILEEQRRLGDALAREMNAGRDADSRPEAG